MSRGYTNKKQGGRWLIAGARCIVPLPPVSILPDMDRIGRIWTG